MALNSGKILMRRGQEANFDPNKMIPGEWAVSLDSKFVRMCFSPGVCIRMATYEAFEADMEQIQEILAECQTVEEAVQRIYEDIKDVAVDVERIEAAAASALKSEENALNSANLAVQSANTATQKASEAAGSANVASAKAEQATEGANTATQKASEAAESADNVRNMSDVSESYAVGGTGTREGEDTDNAKYYNQQASGNADRAEAAAERASAVADVGVATTEKAGLVKPDGETIRVDPDGTIHADRGTTSYTDLENKPSINEVELNGNKTLDELGIASKEALKETDNKVNIIIENAELRFKETASGENIHLDDSADSKLVEFALYGKAVQNGTPTPQNPVDIEVSGSVGNVEVKSVGKNLLPYPYAYDTRIVNGITYNVVKDGSIQVKGNATASARFRVTEYNGQFTLSSGNYIASLKGIVKGSITLTIELYDSGKYIKTCGVMRETEISFEILQADLDSCVEPAIYVYIDVSTNATVDTTVHPMIRLASITDDTYQPYKETLSTIPTDGLAGIKVDSGGNYTDQKGQQWICDEIVKYADGSGEYIKRVENIVFDGVNNICTWVSSSVNNGTLRQMNLGNKASMPNSVFIDSKYILCDKFKPFRFTNINDNFAYGCRQGDNSSICCLLKESDGVTDIASANEWLKNNNVKVYYIINPIRTPLTEEQLAEIEKLSTFYPVTNISNDSGCGMKVKYMADSKNYIDNQLAIQAKLQEEALLNMLLLMPEEVQASMIENDTNKLLSESEV